MGLDQLDDLGQLLRQLLLLRAVQETLAPPDRGKAFAEIGSEGVEPMIGGQSHPHPTRPRDIAFDRFKEQIGENLRRNAVRLAL